ncbi:MAG: helix-turn-helix domain-containing protein [Bacteroidales bacterium]|jgi:transcriptional regulator with XRE-family HTH domain|nr:helix-turn-helix domain-containing protein [Bacteroidales bacterium]MCI2122407.1 helix-turn-helix domain-containing protein [Bacteroidales bacterium]MCI2145053.1 helix-turn-helix domain-containing protein [Bacteroidales bacterium]
MGDFYEYSAPELVHILGKRFRDYRLRANMTQKDVADQTGLTITTIHKFESGMANNLSLGTFILLLKAVGSVDALDQLMPELPESPYLIRNKKQKAQRIRHKKQ